MATVTMKNAEGKEIGNVDLKPEVFETERNIPLMHQAVVTEEANMRQGTADTKKRGEVHGGGRKPWRQKGTGRARQGSIRAPHWPGGGVVWGPHPRSYELKFPKKMRQAALKSALSAKLADGEVVVVEGIAMDSISTKKMAQTLVTLGAEGKVLIILEQMTDEILKSSRNIPNLQIRVAPNFSVRDVINCDILVITKGAVAKVEEVYSA